MTAALDGAQRAVLSDLIQAARSLLEADLDSTLEGDFGIHHSDGRIEETEALSLDASEAAVRIDLLDIIAFLRSEGESEPAAVERLVREAAFTHVNRLVALRVAEGIGILPEAIGNGLASQGFRDFAEIAPASADEEWERFRLFVRICADELSADVPALFDPRNPLLELEPSTAAFSELIELFFAADESIWTAPDALGWSYQFFNTAEERKEMRESSAPRNSRELAVRNQFFTPSYVVEFLVQNGLGAHLAASFPALADEMPLLVEAPERRPEPIDLREVSALDPACGSGHFLLGAYDVLEAAWRHAGVEPEDAAPDIVRSLWGIDIDPRATQIAQAAVILRARRHYRGPLPKPNVICARSLPTTPEAEDLIATLPSHIGRVVRAISDELVMAPVLGPLLKIEERLDREARDAFGSGQFEGTLSEGLSEADTANIESLVLETLAMIADQTTSTASQRLFVAEAHDAVRFVEAMSRRYTACLMNPPFGEPVASTKTYLKAAYPWLPKFEDLLAAFVGRGLELVQPEIGTCSAITSRAGLFLTTYEKWRAEVLLGHRLVALADLGNGVMEQALVEAAAYVLRKTSSTGTGTFIRLLRDTDLGAALRESIQNRRDGVPEERIFSVDLQDLGMIPGSPFAYWMGDSVRSLFGSLHPLEGSGAEVRQGLATSDDFQFVRAFWEVEPTRICYSHDDSRRGMRWVPFAKGGSYSPFWADVHLLVEWENCGARIKALVDEKYPYLNGNVSFVVKNEDHYFRGGVTWPRRTNSAFGARLLPLGSAFADKGPAAIELGHTSAMSVLGWFRSRLVQSLLDAMVAAGEQATSGGASRSYEVGLVQKLPWRDVPELEPIAQRLAQRVADADQRDETTRRFVSSSAGPDPAESIRAQLQDGEFLDDLVNKNAGLDELGLRFLDEEIGPYPTSYAVRDDLDDKVENLWTRPIGDVIDELIEERGGSRAIANLTFVADRRVEVIAHGLELHPDSILRVVEERKLTAPGDREEQAERLLSYVFGVAIGRWDARIGADPAVARVPDQLLAPPARYAPGTLLGPDGLPPATAPDDYPIAFPPDGVLLDQEGHRWDVVACIRTAADAVNARRPMVDDCLTALMGRPNLRRYVRSSFFKSHLSRYSMSRRKAPIYWQLQVPSKAWGVWLYMPRLSREMLFAVVRETEQRQRLAKQRIATLQREYDDGGAGRTLAAVSKELDTEQKLAVELVGFSDDAERVANLGWEPDLDDGAVLNAAPLASLFPAWKEAAKYRAELKQGKHTWSTVSKYANQL